MCGNLENLQEKYDIILKSIEGGVIEFSNINGKIQYVSKQCLEMFQCTEKEFKEHFFESFDVMIEKEERIHVKESMKKQFSMKNTAEVFFHVHDCHNMRRYMRFCGSLQKIAEQEEMVYGVLSDYTKSKKLEEQLDQMSHEMYLETQKYKFLQETIEDITFEYDVETDAAKFFVPTSGKKHRIWPNFMKENKEKYFLDEKDVEDLEQGIEELASFPHKKIMEFRITFQKEKKATWYRMYGVSFENEVHKIYKIVGSLKRLKQPKLSQIRINKEKMDFMTGLYNKDAFRAEVTKRLKTDTDQIRAFAMIDLDKFKRVNESLGNLAGDATIQYIAKEIAQNFMQEEDLLGRIKADVFVAYLEREQIDEIEECIERVFACVKKPFQIDGIDLKMTCSIGVCVFADWEESYENLYAITKESVEVVKERGRNGIEIKKIK